MIDIHHHILPAVDDGAENLAESLQMARMARKDGITDIIATPHLLESSLTWETIRESTDNLNNALKEAKIDLRVHPGAEIATHLLGNREHWLGLAGSHHLLVEFSPYNLLPGAERIFAYLTHMGYQVIIAHPERNAAVIQRPERLLKMLTPGVSLQITAGSLTGDFGKNVRSCARYLIKRQVVKYIATDAHNAHSRPPILSRAVRQAAKFAGQEAILPLVEDNPRAIVTGRPPADNPEQPAS